MSIKKSTASKKERQLHKAKRYPEYQQPHYRPTSLLRQRWLDQGDMHAAMLVGFYAYFGLYAKENREEGARFWREALVVAERMEKTTLNQKKDFAGLVFYVAHAQLDGMGEYRSLFGQPFFGFKILRRAVRLGSKSAPHYYRKYAYDFAWASLPSTIVTGFGKRRTMRTFSVWLVYQIAWTVTFKIMPLVDPPIRLRRD